MAPRLNLTVTGAFYAALFVAANTVLSSPATADSCWDHNGSLMRLKASGNQRWFYYEVPRRVLRRAGVRRGTLLFDGRKIGDRYEGTARRFSKYCPEAPLEYQVEGPVAPSQTRVTLYGERQVQSRCVPTGEIRLDELVFTYSHQC